MTCVWNLLVTKMNDKEFLELLFLNKNVENAISIIDGWGQYFFNEIRQNPKRSLSLHLKQNRCTSLPNLLINSKTPETIFLLRMARLNI